MQSMESLNISARTPPGFCTTLVFSSDNPSNTVISELLPPPPLYDFVTKPEFSDRKQPLDIPHSNVMARPIYAITTTRTLDHSKARGGVITMTEVRTCPPFGGMGELVATWEWKDYTPDIIAMRSRGMRKEPISNWIKKRFIAFSTTAKFKDGSNRTYKWDREGPREQHQLFALDESSTTPIAFFERAQPYVSEANPEPMPSMLHLTPRAEEIREDVILSFLYMEKNRRIEDHTLDMTSRSMAQGMSGDCIN